MTAGEIRGYAVSLHAGHCMANSPTTRSVGVAHRPQYRCVSAHSMICDARPAIANTTSSNVVNSWRKPTSVQGSVNETPSGSASPIAVASEKGPSNARGRPSHLHRALRSPRRAESRSPSRSDERPTRCAPAETTLAAKRTAHRRDRRHLAAVCAASRASRRGGSSPMRHVDLHNDLQRTHSDLTLRCGGHIALVALAGTNDCNRSRRRDHHRRREQRRSRRHSIFVDAPCQPSPPIRVLPARCIAPQGFPMTMTRCRRTVAPMQRTPVGLRMVAPARRTSGTLTALTLCMSACVPLTVTAERPAPNVASFQPLGATYAMDVTGVPDVPMCAQVYTLERRLRARVSRRRRGGSSRAARADAPAQHRQPRLRRAIPHHFL